MSTSAAAGLDARTGAVTIVPVALGTRSYDIHIGEGLIGRAGDIVKPLLRRPRTVVVTDENVAHHHLEPLQGSLDSAGIASETIVLAPGEATKSFAELQRVCDWLLGAGIERGDCIVALGGGVIGDLAGFAAAVVLRGVGFIQIPTTLLAQVDSSVGGKTGINSSLGKNLIGAFHQPLCVIADTAALATLPRRQLAAGYAEVAKYGLIGDAGFFAWLEDNAAALFAGDREAREHAVTVSCRAKARVVAADETEAGVRALLNLGHTFGHALEAAAGFGDRLLHGEAVAVGMAMAFRFSERMAVCRPGAAAQVAGHLASVGLPATLGDLGFDLPGAQEILDLMRKDKKARGGRLTLILARDVGEAFIAPDVADADVLDFLGEELPPMTLTMGIILGAVFGLVLISAFFSGSETSLTATSRARMHELERRGDRRAAIVNVLRETPERLIGSILLGNNLVNILASALATTVFVELFGDAGVVYATIVMTTLVLIFGEVMPKTYALSHPDRFALAVSPILRFLVMIFAPVVMGVEYIVKLALRALGVDTSKAENVLSARDELRGVINLQHKEGAVVKEHRDMLGGILDLKELELSDVMVHRTKMYTVDGAQPLSEIIDEVLKSGRSRIPVWTGDPDNIIGVLHAKDLFAALHAAGGDTSKVDIEAISAAAWFVPDTTPVDDQLNAFLRRKSHFAIVVDEYGEVMGMVTLEDILEEIVGDIHDEHDVAATGVRREATGSYVVDGTVPIRDLNRLYDWTLPDEEATTIAGLVIHEAQMIPEVGQEFTFHGFRFEVLRKRRHQITLLRITRL